MTVSGSFRASQSFYLPSSCSHCASIKAFITSRNWLKTWTCISGPFCAPEAACACLAGLWRDEMRWAVPFSDGTAAILCDQMESSALRHRNSDCKESAWNCALKCSDCINYSIIAHYSFSACVSLYLVFLCLASPEKI